MHLDMRWDDTEYIIVHVRGFYIHGQSHWLLSSSGLSLL